MKKFLVVVIVVFFYAVSAVAQLNTDRLMSVGKNALYFEDYVLSIQYFNQVIRVKPQLIDPYFYRGIAKIQLEDYVGAEADMSIVIERNPFIPMAYYARGFALGSLGRWGEASIDFSMALQYSPDNVLYAINRVEAFRMSHRYIDAITDLDWLITLHPTDVNFHFEKGVVQLESGDTIAAYRTFQNTTSIDSLNPNTWSAFATIAMIRNEDDVARSSFEKSIKYGANDISTHINCGILNYRSHQYNAAMVNFDKAVKIDSTSEVALFNRALLRITIGDYNRAADDLGSILSINPNSYEAIYQRALVNTTIGEYRLAIDDYSRIIKRYPSFVPALYGRADIYERLGRTKDAFVDRDQANQLRLAHLNGSATPTDTIQTDVIMSGIKSSGSIEELVSLFNTQPNEPNDNRYKGTRGMVQNMTAELRQEDNIALSYYKPQTEGLPIALYNPSVLQALNSSGKFTTPLYLVSTDVKLTTQMMNYHFEMVDYFSELIVGSPDDWQLYIARALHYATIQDFDNAINDLSHSILLHPDNTMAFFCRANIRLRQIEVLQHDLLGEKSSESSSGHSLLENNKLTNSSLQNDTRRKTYELIMHDYDYTIAASPDFAFSWYNKANLLVMQNEYQTAINCLSKAIEIEPRFAEAYFNRGLTYLLSSDTDSAIRDLSKAGELGLYRAYSILKRLQNK